jgi:hypothetical protein
MLSQRSLVLPAVPRAPIFRPAARALVSLPAFTPAFTPAVTLALTLALTLVSAFGFARAAQAQPSVLLDFDGFADGTVLDSVYALSDPPLVFSDPLGGSVYARSFGHNTSSPNILGASPTGIPGLNNELGAVDIEIGWSSGQIPVYSVSVQAAAISTIEDVQQPTKRPFMQVWDQNGLLLATVYYQGTLPSNPLNVSPYETLSFALPPCGSFCVFQRIAKVRLSAQHPQGTPPIFGLFDDLRFNPVTCSGLAVPNGDGSSCDGTQENASCGTWTCDPGYLPQGSDPVCGAGGWSGSVSCYAAPSVPLGSEATPLVLAGLIAMLAMLRLAWRGQRTPAG